MLYSDSLIAQQKEGSILKKVSIYFGQLKKQGIQACIHNESDLFNVAKQRKDEEMYKDLMMGCNAQASHYDLYDMDTKNSLTNLYKNEDSDFIIVNMINPHNDNTVIGASTLTFSRKKNEIEVHIINNRYKYNNENRELIKGSSISDFNVEEKMKLIEDYLYYKKKNSISDKSRNKPATGSYYVVARINGRFLIKDLLDYSPED